MLSLVSKLAICCSVKASPYCNCRNLEVVVDSTVAGSLLTSTLARERGTHSMHSMAPAVGTVLVLQILVICVLYVLNELGSFVDPLALLPLFPNRTLFCRVGNKRVSNRFSCI